MSKTRQPTAWTARTLWLPLLFLAVGGATYQRGLSSPFFFDDEPAIVENPNIRSLTPLGKALWAPPGTPVTARPVVSFSLAINHALGGLEVFGYHLFSLLVHLACALLLFGCVRRTLCSPALCARWSRLSVPLALGVSLLWLVHPLNSEAVLYATQRTELLMALFFLGALYCGQRALAAPASKLWPALAVVACALGMASKEVMVVAPLVLVLFDRAYHFGSLAEGLRKRGRWYLALASTWAITAALLASAPHQKSIGLASETTPWSYLMSQALAIAGYLRLSLVPTGLVVDYGEAVPVSFAAAAPAGLLVLALLGATAWAWRTRPAWGFVGAWFFLVLAPTSSVVPIFTEVAAERRMYLPLAAVLAGLAVALCWAAERLSKRPASARGVLAVTLLLVLPAAAGTRARAGVYDSAFSLWADTVHKRPDNHRAHNNLAKLLFERGEAERALTGYREALRLNPRYAHAWTNLCAVQVQLGHSADAVESCRRALALRDDLAATHNALASALAALGRPDEALPTYQRAIALAPDDVDARMNFGLFLFKQARAAEAWPQLEKAVALAPESWATHNALGACLIQAGREPEGAGHLRKAIALNPKSAQPWLNLARGHAAAGNHQLARTEATRAAELEDGLGDAHNTLVFALLGLGKRDEARSHLQALVARQPRSVIGWKNLGIVAAQDGRFDEAERALETAARLEPGAADVASLLAQVKAKRAEAPR